MRESRRRTARSVRAIPEARKALEIREIRAIDKIALGNGFNDVGHSLVAASENARTRPAKLS